LAESSTDLAAKRYARAAFELAQAANDTATWEAAIDQMAQFMAEPEVKQVLENTRVAQDAKLQLIEAALNDLAPQPLNLARLLVRKKRTALAPEIAASFRAMVQELSGIQRVHASTAVPLTDTERIQLQARLRESTGHEVVLETDVDPALIGGIVVQIGDRLIDASTRARLQLLKRTLTGAVS
jgi:F-type H+-transporting ATPase subunit delta